MVQRIRDFAEATRKNLGIKVTCGCGKKAVFPARNFGGFIALGADIASLTWRYTWCRGAGAVDGAGRAAAAVLTMPRSARETRQCDARAMPLSLDDLMPSQLRLLAKLCGSDEPVDAIGCELSDLSDAEVLTGQTMFPLGLIEVVDGWRGTHWLVLTGYAQRLLEEGLAN